MSFARAEVERWLPGSSIDRSCPCADVPVDSDQARRLDFRVKLRLKVIQVILKKKEGVCQPKLENV